MNSNNPTYHLHTYTYTFRCQMSPPNETNRMRSQYIVTPLSLEGLHHKHNNESIVG